MKVLAFAAIFSTMVLGGLWFMAEPVSTTINNQEENKTMDQNTLDSNSTILDVRTIEEYTEGYITGAINHPLDKIENGVMPETQSKDSKLLVYCRSGNRSAAATDLLRKAGFTNVKDLGSVQDVLSLGGRLNSN